MLRDAIPGLRRRRARRHRPRVRGRGRAREREPTAASGLRRRAGYSNPNICTLESATGVLLELKVTKRSFESPGPGGFGSSEYSRVAVAQGGVAAVPQILARRLQTRYRFDDNASVIEALEIQNVYDWWRRASRTSTARSPWPRSSRG